jgi:hypothetical protein
MLPPSLHPVCFPANRVQRPKLFLMLFLGFFMLYLPRRVPFAMDMTSNQAVRAILTGVIHTPASAVIFS